MATLQTLIARIQKARTEIETELPRRIAQSMLEETEENFRTESYGNDDRNEKWEDRYGTLNGKLQNVEQYLRYKKLQYSGQLRRGAKAKSGKGFAAVTFAAPYAQAQNEGLPSAGGDTLRKPPKSSKSLRIGSNPHARRFAGVGKRTYRNAGKQFAKTISRIVGG